MMFISGLLAGVWIGFFIFACVDISREADKNESLFLLENKLVQIKNNLKTLNDGDEINACIREKTYK